MPPPTKTFNNNEKLKFDGNQWKKIVINEKCFEIMEINEINGPH